MLTISYPSNADWYIPAWAQPPICLMAGKGFCCLQTDSSVLWLFTSISMCTFVSFSIQFQPIASCHLYMKLIFTGQQNAFLHLALLVHFVTSFTLSCVYALICCCVYQCKTGFFFLQSEQSVYTVCLSKIKKGNIINFLIFVYGFKSITMFHVL